MTALLCTVLILSADPAAHTAPAPPNALTVFRCGFEADSDANFDDWPDGWKRLRDSGYPDYVPIEIVPDDATPSANNQCLRVQLDGGAARVFTPSIVVSPQFSYVLSARLRAQGLKNSRVTCSIAFYDDDGKFLEAGESEPVRDASAWRDIRLGPLTPSSDRARSAILSLHVRASDTPDLTGSVALDDLTLVRLPRMSVSTPREYNLFTDPREVRITCRASGLTEENPQTTFALLDMHGATLAVSRQTMTTVAEQDPTDSSRPHDTSPGTRREFTGVAQWQPPIADVGFYRVLVTPPGHAGQLVNLVVVPPRPDRIEGEFGWSIPLAEPPGGLRRLPRLLDQVGVHWVKVPAWYAANDRERAECLAWFAERLTSQRMQVVGVLDEPPPELQESFGVAASKPAAWLFEDRAVWQRAVDPVLTRLSLKIHWWQLGRDEDTSFHGHADLDRKIAEIRDELARFGQTVKIGIPWRVIDPPPVSPSPPWSFLSFQDDLPLTEAEILSYLERDESPPSQRWVMLPLLPHSEYDVATRARDLVLRMVAAKVARATGIFLADPFHAERGVMTPEQTPGDMLLPWRTAATLLAGGAYLGQIRLPHGSENRIFQCPGQCVMVLWNDQPVTETMYLGDEARLFDVWGRHTTPPTQREGNVQWQEIPVGPVPVFVTGVDPYIARWRLNFQLETSRLESIFGREQMVAYRFQNTFPAGVGGRISIHAPPGWRSRETLRQFKIAPEEERQDHFRVELGPNTSSGTHLLRIDIDLSADRDLHFSLYEPLQVGLDDITLELETRFDDQGNLLVDQHLINHTEQHVNFNCLLFAPGRRREKRQVIQLEQGRRTNTFVLPQGESLVGKTLWFRAEEIGGSRVLNSQITVRE